MITNDDAAADTIAYRFKTSLPQATLNAGESVILDIRQTGVYLEGSAPATPYRIQVEA